MRWKNWPYWLKGGIIAGTISALVIILSFLSCEIADIVRGYDDICIGTLFLVLLSMPNFFVFRLLGFLFNGGLDVGLIVFYLILIFVYFVIGIVGGWIIEKLKKND